jgi:iron complex outermembrane recepter protein
MNRALLASAAALAFAWTPAFAADAAAGDQNAPQNPSTSSANGGFGEIVVYAQRKAENLQKVPVAVTVVSGDELAQRKMNDLTQITLAAPSFQVTTDNAFTLRGIGSQIWVAQVDSSVGVSVDDVSLGVPLFMSNGIFDDVAQIAVLDGPQGLLFGRNASAGLLQIVSNRPVIGKTSGDISFEYDDRDKDPGGHLGLVGKATLNLPVSSNSALRINLLGSIQNPVVDYTVNTSPNAQLNQTRLAGKAKYLWEPSKDTSLYIIADYSRERGTGGIWDRSYRTDSGTTSGTWSGPGDALEGCTAGPNNLCAGVDGPNYRSVDTYGISANFTQKLNPSLTLSNIAAWRQYNLSLALDVDYTAINAIDLNESHQVYRQFSDELRLSYKNGKLDGQVGVYWFNSVNDSQSMLGMTAGGPLVQSSYYLGGDVAAHNTDASIAAFGQFNYHVTDAWRLIFGARETHDSVGMASNEEALATYTIAVDGPTGRYAYRQSVSNFSYKLGTQYDLTPGTMLYVTWSTGYKGPAELANVQGVTSTGALISPYIAPETVTDLEGGIKAYFFDRRLRFNLGAFIEKFKNFQTQTFNAAADTIIYANAGGAKSTGVTLDSSAKLTNNFTINWNALYTHAKFTDFLTSCYPGQTAAQGCNLTTNVMQAAGLAPPTAARFTSTLEGVYTVPLGDNTLTLEANWYHRSSINYSPNGDPLTEQGPVNTLGANITFHYGANTTASIFCKNCTNQLVPTYMSREPIENTVVQSWGYDSVRTIGVSFNQKF